MIRGQKANCFKSVTRNKVIGKLGCRWQAAGGPRTTHHVLRILFIILNSQLGGPIFGADGDEADLATALPQLLLDF